MVGLIRRSDNAVVAQYGYRPFGLVEQDNTTIANSLRWQGLQYDRETGLYYVRSRYFDPELTRFVSEDPIGLEGGINLYVFAGNDPVTYSDPFGLCPACAVVWAVVEGAASAYDLYDLGRTAVNYTRRRATKRELSVTAAGAGMGLFLPGGGLGKGGRLALNAADSWGNATTLARHFRDHGADFGAKTAGEYADMASDFLQRAQREGLPTKIDSDGVIRVFDPGANTFGAYTPDGTTRTFFKPTSATYWDRQPGALR